MHTVANMRVCIICGSKACGCGSFADLNVADPLTSESACQPRQAKHASATRLL